MLIVGMMFFTLGAELAMTPVGERIGTRIAQSRKLELFASLFRFRVCHYDIGAGSAGACGTGSVRSQCCTDRCSGSRCGVFLMIAMLRMLFSKTLRMHLIIFYLLIFALAFFVPDDFISVAFDSGGVTTGPMTVPFIMALGVGFAAVRSDKHAEDDSFGLVALCSIGPILAVLLLGLLYHPGKHGLHTVRDSGDPGFGRTLEIFCYRSATVYRGDCNFAAADRGFLCGFSDHFPENEGRALLKVVIGILYTYVGLVLFLTGVNVGFMPAGNYLGETIAGLSYRWVLIPIGMVIDILSLRPSRQFTC